MFTLDDDIMRQLRATFKVEAAEHIQAMNRVLLALEENPEGEERNKLLEEIFREAHSLKGAAGAADFPEVESTAHKLESAFGAAKSGKIKLTRDLCDVLYEGIDAVSVIVNAALEEREHGLDLEDLHLRLAAVEQGQAIPKFAPPDTPLKGVLGTGRQAKASSLQDRNPSPPLKEEWFRVTQRFPYLHGLIFRTCSRFL
jgi:two-component system, chemotaxis family, sensor kinase CheA